MQDILLTIYYLGVLFLGCAVVETSLRRIQVVFYLSQFVIATGLFLAPIYLSAASELYLPSLYFVLLSMVGLLSSLLVKEKSAPTRYHSIALVLVYFGVYLATQVSRIEAVLIGLSLILLAEILYRLSDRHQIVFVDLLSMIAKQVLGAFVCVAALTGISPVVMLWAAVLWMLMPNLHWEKPHRVESYIATLLLPTSVLAALYERLNFFLNKRGVVSDLLTSSTAISKRALYKLYALDILENHWFVICWFFLLVLLAALTISTVARTTEKKPLFRISTLFSVLIFLLSLGSHRPEFLFVAAISVLYLVVCRLLASLIAIRWWGVAFMTLGVPGTLFGFVNFILVQDVINAFSIFDWQSQLNFLSALPLLGGLLGLFLFWLLQLLLVAAVMRTKTAAVIKRKRIYSLLYLIPILFMCLLALPFTVGLITGFRSIHRFDFKRLLAFSSPVLDRLYESYNNIFSITGAVIVLAFMVCAQFAVLYLREMKDNRGLVFLKLACAHGDIVSAFERYFSHLRAAVLRLIIKATPRKSISINRCIYFIVCEWPHLLFTQFSRGITKLNDTILTRHVYEVAFFGTHQCAQIAAYYWKKLLRQKLKSNDETTIGWALFFSILFILGVVAWA